MDRFSVAEQNEVCSKKDDEQDGQQQAHPRQECDEQGTQRQSGDQRADNETSATNRSLLGP
jgi:hypothetical protein